MRTSRDPGAPVADDGDLVDERDAAEHGGELRLGHLLRQLPHEQLHGLPGAPFRRRRLVLVLVAVDAVLRHCARVCGGGRGCLVASVENAEEGGGDGRGISSE
jgi:hypothetical protein